MIIGGKQSKRPYHVNDFDLLVVEIRDVDNPEKYNGPFCIIPKEVLELRGFLENETQKGKLSLAIYPPDYHKFHWTLEFWTK